MSIQAGAGVSALKRVQVAAQLEREGEMLKKLALVLALLLTVGMTACEREGPAERTGEEIDEAAEEAGEALEEAGEETREE
ncbi:MAG: hypothetical protein C4520_01805 [Candidatus Abyssobacteria bacterium SURF_5]|uniref:Uncharacterized protein n=1 Tax=Abyssobacteria bacterium (strain SURF_5) TaxID=2093360 RepID=A0A3A4P8Q9_ABYX5|nr:MAG: hypothetical protein C4520_01805 [Candidatus Abyssubacteria bacterium SURF_5]